MLRTKEIDGYRTRLRGMLARAGDDRDELRCEAMQPIGGEASGGISNVPVHPADLANRASEEDVSLSLLENEAHRMGEINAGLERIDEGTFGRCETCGRAIGTRRLNALPYTRYCLTCERRHETQPSP